MCSDESYKNDAKIILYRNYQLYLLPFMLKTTLPPLKILALLYFALMSFADFQMSFFTSQCQAFNDCSESLYFSFSQKCLMVFSEIILMI